MSEYTVIIGDTYEKIARKAYGTEDKESLVRSANPGVLEPLTPGISIHLPVDPSAPQDRQQSTAGNLNEVSILLNNKVLRYWSRITISRSVDTFDTVSVEAPFDDTDADHRNLFRPFQYDRLIVSVGGVPLFTGTAVSVVPQLLRTSKKVKITGYSLPGVLGDCTAPPDSAPIEFNDQALPAIAATLTRPFGIGVDIDADTGSTFERVAMGSGESVYEFLTKLAKQRNVVIGTTESGRLKFWQSATDGVPVAKLIQGNSPVLSVVPQFNPQQYYSHVTGIEPAYLGLSGTKFTVKNERLAGVLRPHVFQLPDTQAGDMEIAVRAKVARMFGNMASYTVECATWRSPAGKLWAPNDVITLQAPSAMVYEEYKFVVRSVDFVRSDKEFSAALSLMIPGSFSGELPDKLPWEAAQ